jgi:hypothetical protein
MLINDLMMKIFCVLRSIAGGRNEGGLSNGFCNMKLLQNLNFP